jgi:hypothetical protein
MQTQLFFIVDLHKVIFFIDSLLVMQNKKSVNIAL